MLVNIKVHLHEEMSYLLQSREWISKRSNLLKSSIYWIDEILMKNEMLNHTAGHDVNTARASLNSYWFNRTTQIQVMVYYTEGENFMAKHDQIVISFLKEKSHFDTSYY